MNAVEGHESDREARGRNAKRPWQVPWTGWKDVLWRLYREIDDDQIFDQAAAVAFYGLLALFPALIATVSMYGILADPIDIVRQLDTLSVAIPPTARTLIVDQLNEIRRSDARLGFGLIVSLAVALFSASGGVAGLMRGINMAYDEAETRGWIRFRVLALMFTLGLALFVIVSVGVITLLPVVLEFVGWAETARDAINVLRWPALALATMVGLGILYRYAPNRTPPKWHWVTPGSLLATLIWTLASLAFGIYAENFGSYNKTYGTLGGAVVLGLWMYLSSLAILLGAELNAELEHQTEEDSTVGPPRPMGQRAARMADHLGEARPQTSEPSDSSESWFAGLNRGRRQK
ncbi:MAG TPA: YihY/virulence factor BrkB family protein [Polyangiaceae bacterium]|nr:YihY/virulence factor BrkB family protein [Polyangiaceae bacterium]